VSSSTVIITGATKGLGRATALVFARAGQQVIGLYARDDVAAELLREELKPFGGGSLVVKHDVGAENGALWNREEIQQARRLVLINNAWAHFTPRPFHLLPWDDVDSGFNVGVRGSWLCSRALLRPMVRAGQGTIVNVLTTALRGLPPKGFAAYAIAKHALRGLTLALAAEYSAKGIRVFSVSPGFMSTALTAGWDARLVEAIRGSGPTSDSGVAAQRIWKLVEGQTAQGEGEDHLV
jgi:3-oxoacyl-[acyl-carrier protein] reductase